MAAADGQGRSEPAPDASPHRAADDPRVSSALEWCRRRGLTDVTLAIPFALAPEAATRLLQHEGVTSLLLAEPSSGELPREALGAFLPSDYSWRLPDRTGRCILFVADRAMLTWRMISAALRRGVRTMVLWDIDRWTAKPLTWLAIQKVASKALSPLSVGLVASRLTPAGALSPWVDAWYRRVFNRLLALAPNPMPGAPGPLHVVIACPTLVAGGAERQIVNTAIGLSEQGIAKVTVLVSSLTQRPGNAFFLPALQAGGIDVREVSGPTDSLGEWEHYRSLTRLTEARGLRSALRGLPGPVRQELVNVYFMLQDMRPSVVHAWLDHSNVIAGLAAVLAGIPRVILSGRNVAPVHFPYIFQPYMRAAYQVLANRREVVLVNNSHGGTADYAAWLGLPRSRFRVLYNGLSLDSGGRADPAAIAAFRERHAIPPKAVLIGGMFRLSAEKRPMLWLETATRVTRARDDVRFLLFGEGPLQEPIVRRIEREGRSEQIRLAPPTADSALALSAFDLLLLTSKWEGTPNVAIEAQAVGTPLMTCGGGGAREALKDGVTGLYVEPSDPERLSAAVLELLADPSRLREMASAGPAFVTERFGIRRMIHETLALYPTP